MLHVKELLLRQERLNEAMGYPMGEATDHDGSNAVKENMLALIVEATEVLAEVNWKPWKLNQKEINRKAVTHELIDVLQFWVNACNALNLTPQEIEDAYHEKLQICYKRIDTREVTNGQA